MKIDILRIAQEAIMPTTKINDLNILPGGEGDDLSPDDVTPEELEEGLKVEEEHIDPDILQEAYGIPADLAKMIAKKIQEEITLDHYAEGHDYYDKLEKMEETLTDPVEPKED